ncbi:hypothetical protein RhiJN_20186 [Ceratobasidium sp. AG-Ba]|nr:hypothetical protein RhiJN_20186 [Ceratobasidium sp. AG-Ba]
MSTEGAIRKKHVPVKTSKLIEYEAERVKSKEIRTSISHTKHVQAKMATLEEEEEEDLDQPAEQKKGKKSGPKGKKVAEPLEEDSDEDNSMARMQLIFMIHGQYGTPLEHLQSLDMATLQDYWKSSPPNSLSTMVPTKGKALVQEPNPKLNGKNTSKASLTAASGHSKSTAPPASYSCKPTVHKDTKMFNLNLNNSEVRSEPKEVKPKKTSNKKSDKPAKPRAKKGNYKDGVGCIIIDQALQEIIALLSKKMCANLDKVDLLVHKGWAKALDFCSQPANMWVLDEGLLRTVILQEFKLAITPDQLLEDVKKKAAKLLPSKFHQAPKAGKNATKPTALCFPDSMNPPLESIVYLVALGSDIITRLSKDGCIVVESRNKSREVIEPPKETKLGEKTRTSIDPVKPVMVTHLKNLETFQQLEPGTLLDIWQKMYKSAMKCIGKEVEDVTNGKTTPAPSLLSLSAFSGKAAYLQSIKSAQPLVDADSHIRPQPQPQPQPCPTQLSKPADTKDQPDNQGPEGLPVPVPTHCQPLNATEVGKNNTSSRLKQSSTKVTRVESEESNEDILCKMDEEQDCGRKERLEEPADGDELLDKRVPGRAGLLRSISPTINLTMKKGRMRMWRTTHLNNQAKPQQEGEAGHS